MIKNFLLAVIRLYQRYLSPVIAPRCRYYPTCSSYGRQAILWHGAYRGLLLTIRRVASCHPWGGSGVDFVPLPLYRWQYQPANIEWMAQVRGVYVDCLFYGSRLNIYLQKYA